MRPIEEFPASAAEPARASARVTEVGDCKNSGELRIDLCAHNSLTLRQTRWFLVTVAIGPIMTAGFCALQGYWPVLPFAGMELGLLYLALRWSMRRGRQRESISITTDYVTIDAQHGVAQANTRFPRHWTRVKLRAPQNGQYPSRLCFESQGRACEVGSFLTDDERRALAARLQQLIGNMNDSPAL